VARVKFGVFVQTRMFPRSTAVMKPAVILKRDRHTVGLNCARDDQILDRNGELPSFPEWGTSWFFCVF